MMMKKENDCFLVELLAIISCHKRSSEIRRVTEQ